MQDSAGQATDDLHEKGFSGTLEIFLSEKIGYAKGGCEKSLVKKLDEYYWLRLYATNSITVESVIRFPISIN